jgi:hypothetical protein
VGLTYNRGSTVTRPSPSAFPFRFARPTRWLLRDEHWAGNRGVDRRPAVRIWLTHRTESCRERNTHNSASAKSGLQLPAYALNNQLHRPDAEASAKLRGDLASRPYDCPHRKLRLSATTVHQHHLCNWSAEPSLCCGRSTTYTSCKALAKPLATGHP